MHAPPGFSPDGVVSTRLLLPGSTYKDLPDRSRFVARITEQVRALPGVTSAGIVSEMPLAHEYNDTFFDIQERPPRSHAERDNADFRSVTRGYLEAMRIPLLRGRLFEHSELGRPPVVLVDESFVRKYFPGEDPIGKHIVLGNPCEIIGVVGGIRYFSLRIAPRPTIYLPFDQFDADSFHIFVRTAGNPAALASPIRSIVAGLDRDVALSDFVPMEHVVSESVAAERFDAILLSIFALLAVLLAVAGVYGVFSYVVAQQTHEIGVRMALGAAPGRMLRLFLGRGFALGAAGAAIGSLAAWFLVTLLSKELYGVRPHDAMTFAAAVVVLVLVAVTACAIPGRRAMRVDPLVALRYE